VGGYASANGRGERWRTRLRLFQHECCSMKAS